MREDLTLENLAGEPAAVRVEVSCDADFADLFEVKESRVPSRAGRGEHPRRRAAPVRSYPARASPRCRGQLRRRRRDGRGLSFDVVVPPRGRWKGCLQVVPIIDDHTLSPRFPTSQPLAETGAALRAQAWRDKVPVIETAHPGLARTLQRSQVDLGALRIFDPEQPDSTSSRPEPRGS